MACFKILLLLALTAEAARQAPAQKKLEKSQTPKNTTEPAKVLEKVNTTQPAKADEKMQEKEKMMMECEQKMFDMLQHVDQRNTAGKCEKEGKFTDQVIADIQKDDDAAAKAEVEKLFTKCASLPADCATEVAPQLIEMLRLSGAAVAEKCRIEMRKPQEDEKLMIEAGKCDQKNNISEHTLDALNAGNVSAAQGFAQQALVQCMNVSKSCAHQVAPAFLNTAMMHVMEERAMEEMMKSGPVLVIQPVIMVTPDQIVTDDKGHHNKSLSLLSMAAAKNMKQMPKANMRGAKSPALLQIATHKGPWISGLLMKLALNK